MTEEENPVRGIHLSIAKVEPRFCPRWRSLSNCRERLIDSLAGAEGRNISFTRVPMLYRYLCAHPVDPWWRGVVLYLYVPCLALPCLALPCLALPCLPSRSVRHMSSTFTARFSTFSLSFHRGHANSPRELIQACEKIRWIYYRVEISGTKGRAEAGNRKQETGNEINTTAQLLT